LNQRYHPPLELKRGNPPVSGSRFFLFPSHRIEASLSLEPTENGTSFLLCCCLLGNPCRLNFLFPILYTAVVSTLDLSSRFFFKRDSLIFFFLNRHDSPWRLRFLGGNRIFVSLRLVFFFLSPASFTESFFFSLGDVLRGEEMHVIQSLGPITGSSFSSVPAPDSRVKPYLSVLLLELP